MQTKRKRWALSLVASYPYVDLDNSRGDVRLWRGPTDLFDAFALGFIGTIGLVLAVRSGALQPFISDTYYHLAIAKQIQLRGELPTWVDWDYAPVGRPHLYPPLLHVILACLGWLTGSVLTAGKVLAVAFLPASFISCWCLARWVFDSRTALVAVLLLSLDSAHAIVELIYIPSCFVNILAPILVMTFLTRRTWPSIVLLTLMLYAHIAIPYLVVVGLVLFGLKYRRYRGEMLKVVGVSLLWVSPWIVRTVMEKEWIAGVVATGGLPMGLLKRVTSLQMFNLVLIGCGLWGIRRLRRSRVQEAIIRWMLLGMVPLLFSYGGRFTMHSAPWWALSASTVVVPLLPAQAGWRRAAALVGATVLPYPALLPLTTTHAVILLAIRGKPMLAGDRKKSEAYLPDCDQAIRWIEAHTRPGEVVYTNKEWLGDMIPLLSDRRSDFGCWWECSREIGKLQNRYYRDDGRRATFLCIRPDSDVGSILGPTPTMPPVDWQADIGRLRVGIRYRRVFANPRPLDNFETGDRTLWQPENSSPRCRLLVRSESVPERGYSRRYLSWELPPGRDRVRIVRPVQLGSASGVAMNVRTSAPLGNVKLGLGLSDGSRYEWTLSLPCVAEPVSPEDINRALWVRVRLAFDLMALVKGRSEATKPQRSKVSWLYLECPQEKTRSLRIDIDDIELMDVHVVRGEDTGS